MTEDEAMVITKNEKIIKTYFKEGRLLSLPNNRQKRLVVLENILKLFEMDHEYGEREVNTILLNVYDDVFLIRRELIESNLMKRTRDGRSYWINTEYKNI